MNQSLSEQDSVNKIEGVRQFLDALKELKPSPDFDFYYRGHANVNFMLKPSIYRDPRWIKHEEILFKEMVLKCPEDFKAEDNTFQMLVKMQHYSLPTRLFDPYRQHRTVD